MNILLLISGILVLMAALIHAIVDDKECRRLEPSADSSGKGAECWMQLRSGWHWVSVDLLLSGLVLLLIATSDVIEAKKEIAVLLCIYFFVCGIAWVGTVSISMKNSKQVLSLGQWLFCFVVSGLIYFGI